MFARRNDWNYFNADKIRLLRGTENDRHVAYGDDGKEFEVPDSEVTRLSSSFIPGSGTVVIAYCEKPKEGEKLTTENVDLQERDIVGWRIGQRAPYPIYLGMQLDPRLVRPDLRLVAVRQRDGKTYIDADSGDLYDSLESLKEAALEAAVSVDIPV